MPASLVPSPARLLSCAALALVTTSCAAAADPRGANHPLLGQPAPELGAEAIQGVGPKSLAEAKGKVVIVDFWGTFCEPCKKSFPKYQAIADKFGADVAVLGVAIDDAEVVKREKVAEFANDHHAKFAIVWDKQQVAVEKYGMRKLTVPTSFILDRKGVVRHVHVGFVDGEEQKVAEEIKALLSTH